MNVIRGYLNLHWKVLGPVLAGLVYFAGRWVAEGTVDKVGLVSLITTGAYGLIGYGAPDAKVVPVQPACALVPSDAEVAKG